jgi:hypothetical protein
MQLTPLQVPVMHVAPAQQGWPERPHDSHVDVAPEHTTSLPVHRLPGQHASPMSPQIVQVLVDVWQTSVKPALPLLQLPSGQQVSPSLPHVWQVLVASQ